MTDLFPGAGSDKLTEKQSEDLAGVLDGMCVQIESAQSDELSDESGEESGDDWD